MPFSSNSFRFRFTSVSSMSSVVRAFSWHDDLNIFEQPEKFDGLLKHCEPGSSVITQSGAVM